ncbi:hypothetical protein JVT61DRAFT_9227 [Boletus reticuloceps]|uniref:Uncharacterized protein n=1 Tax=Boletus reticuloceps TaxID=495285 RepID=A0A8I2YGP3_9AGAM|nr:hypothetical protein JVT61DRAFT_9227 [Boletus reticuloceps]
MRKAWRRSLLDVDRGPWPDTLSYIKAVIEIEKKWLENFAVPRNRRDIFYRPNHEEKPDSHIRLLDKFLAVIPSILPPDEFCAPMLWHTNLQAINIFVSSEGPPDIASIVVHRYDGDDRITIVPREPILPLLPPDFDKYSKEEQAYLKREEKLAQLHKYYEACIIERNALFAARMTYPHVDRIVALIALLDFERDWDDIALGEPFPISWDASEVARHRKAYPKLTEHEWRVRAVAKALDLALDGWVTNEQYDDVTRRNKIVIKHWKSRWGGPYSFQEGGRSWNLL